MPAAPLPLREPERLDALRRLELLDTAPEETFDALARLASALLGVPIAVVSLVDEHRQWFKASVGLDASETPREAAFCAHAILGDTVFVVNDTRHDARFADNPLVTGEPRIRAYAGVPLRTRDGHALGTLCAIDRRPRVFTERELALLEDLAGIARREIQQREQAIATRLLARTSTQAAIDSETLYQATFSRAAVGIALVGLDGRFLRMNPALCRILGRDEPALRRATFQEITHADDLGMDLGLVRQLLDGDADHYALEKRYLRPDGGTVWANLTVTLVSDAAGLPQHFVSIIEDITTRRHTEAALQKLRQQLEDRVVERTAELQRANAWLADAVEQRRRSEAAVAEREGDLRAVLNHANDAYICIDDAGLIVEWNPKAERTFGWTRTEAVGRRIDELIIPLAQREAHRAGLARLTATGAGRLLDQRIEVPAVSRNGAVFPCEMTLSRFVSPSRGTLYAAFLHDISARKDHERRLADASARLEDLYEHAPCGYYSLDARGVFVQINDHSLKLFGRPRHELLGKASPRDFLAPDSRRRFAEAYLVFMREGHFGPEEFDLEGGDGERRRISVRATAVRGPRGEFMRSRTVMIDVSELHRMRETLQAVNRQQALMLDNELVGIVRVRHRRIVWANRAFGQLLGYAADELIGRPTRDLYASVEVYRTLGAAAHDATAQGETFRTQTSLVRKNGETIWVDISGAQLADDGNESLWMLLDVTAMKQDHTRVEALAYHDALTGLPNRRLLMDRLSVALAAAARTSQRITVCFADLNGFKAINDRHGHEAGDLLLREVARRLSTQVRAHDTVARLGGDEFVLVLTGLGAPDEDAAVMRRAAAAIAAPVTLPDGAAVTVTASFGVAEAEPGETDAAALVARADEAMYVVKRQDRALRSA